MLLITGATGFLGTNIIREIGKGRREIRILTTDPGKAKGLYPKYEIVKGDITRPESLKGVGKDIDVVIHLAGIVSYSKPRDVLFKINAEGTRNVLEACRNADKFLFSSSVSVYGEIIGQADESYPRNPRNPYGESKREAENIVRDSSVKNLVFRTAPVYGEGSPYWCNILSLLERGFPIPRTSNLTHVVHVKNVVQAFSLGLKRKSEGTYNIADEEPVSFMAFAETLVRLLGKEPRILPYGLVSFLARLRGMKTYLDVLTANRNYDIYNARKDLKYNPRLDFKNELKKMVDWYKQK